MIRLLHLWAMAFLLNTAPVAAQPFEQDGENELIADDIHSDLPLFTFDWDDFWPRGFVDEDSFGCFTKVSYGDWQFTPTELHYDDGYWIRISNYGVFHCAANIQTAGERAELDDGDFSRGFFALLEQGAKLNDEQWELWVLQDGFARGSDYILLARPSGPEGLVEKFSVLQRRCPSGMVREAEGLDVWQTRYCAINSQADLISLAQAMLKLPPLGRLELSPEQEGAD